MRKEGKSPFKPTFLFKKLELLSSLTFLLRSEILSLRKIKGGKEGSEVGGKSLLSPTSLFKKFDCKLLL